MSEPTYRPTVLGRVVQLVLELRNTEAMVDEDCQKFQQALDRLYAYVDGILSESSDSMGR